MNPSTRPDRPSSSDPTRGGARPRPGPARRSPPARLLVLLTLIVSIVAAFGCGGDGGGGDEDTTVPPLTRDFGGDAYAFVTQDGTTGEITRILLHSDGVQATVVVLRNGTLQSPFSAVLYGLVADDATIDVGSGQVNVDADDTFTDNDIVPADGFVLVAGDEIASQGVTLGNVLEVNYDFRAILAEKVDRATALGL